MTPPAAPTRHEVSASDVVTAVIAAVPGLLGYLQWIPVPDDAKAVFALSLEAGLYAFLVYLYLIRSRISSWSIKHVLRQLRLSVALIIALTVLSIVVSDATVATFRWSTKKDRFYLVPWPVSSWRFPRLDTLVACRSNSGGECTPATVSTDYGARELEELGGEKGPALLEQNIPRGLAWYRTFVVLLLVYLATAGALLWGFAIGAIRGLRPKDLLKLFAP